MWIFTKTGFYSIVNHNSMLDCYLVRARVKEDLVDLINDIYRDPAHGSNAEANRDYAISTIEDDETADYRWRVALYREDVIDCLAQQMEDIDYTTNVKGTIDKGQKDRHSALMGVWDSMMNIQEGGAYQWQSKLPADWNPDDPVEAETKDALDAALAAMDERDAEREEWNP